MYNTEVLSEAKHRRALKYFRRKTCVLNKLHPNRGYRTAGYDFIIMYIHTSIYLTYRAVARQNQTLNKQQQQNFYVDSLAKNIVT